MPVNDMRDHVIGVVKLDDTMMQRLVDEALRVSGETHPAAAAILLAHAGVWALKPLVASPKDAAELMHQLVDTAAGVFKKIAQEQARDGQEEASSRDEAPFFDPFGEDDD